MAGLPDLCLISEYRVEVARREGQLSDISFALRLAEIAERSRHGVALGQQDEARTRQLAPNVAQQRHVLQWSDFPIRRHRLRSGDVAEQS